MAGERSSLVVILGRVSESVGIYFLVRKRGSWLGCEYSYHLRAVLGAVSEYSYMYMYMHMLYMHMYSMCWLGEFLRNGRRPRSVDGLAALGARTTLE